MGNVFNHGYDRVTGHKGGVYDDIKAFNLEVSLVQGFKGTPIIEVMVEWYGKVRIHDGGDKGRMFDRGWK